MKSFRLTIAAAGTSQPGPDVIVPSIAIIKFITGNTGLGFVNNEVSGDLSGNSYELDPGEKVFVDAVNLKEINFDVSVNGETFCIMLP